MGFKMNKKLSEKKVNPQPLSCTETTQKRRLSLIKKLYIRITNRADTKHT